MPFDIAWKQVGSRYDVVLIFVDNPTRPLEAQVAELPFVCWAQPKIPILIRSTDAQSRFHRESGKWVATGRRHAELTRAFGEKGKGAHVTPLKLFDDIQAYYDT